jgi:hypothetical protein
MDFFGLFKATPTNEELINKYKNEKIILTNLYEHPNKYGKYEPVKGIVNPAKIDNRQIFSVADNQGDLPACAGYSACQIAESIYWKQTGKLVQLNAEQVYAKAKEIDGDVKSDGTYLECALQAAINLCAFPKSKNLKVKTFQNTHDDTTKETLKFLIHQNDFIQLGANITDAWYKVNNKNFKIQESNNYLGGHAFCGVGYDSDGLYIQNSWGKDWGAKSFAIWPWKLVLKDLYYAAFVSED